MPEITGTPEQLAIWDYLRTGTSHAIVDACAGSGKTFTLIHGCTFLRERRDLRIGLFAFNKHIAEELNSRMSAAAVPNATATTFNSFGMRQVSRSMRGQRLKLEQFKSYDIVETLCGGRKNAKYYAVSTPVAKLTALCKSSLLPPTEENLEYLVDKFDVDTSVKPSRYGYDDDDEQDGGAVKDVFAECVKLVPRVLDMTIKWARTGVIDYDDQIYLPIKLNMQVEQFDLLMVDESQDLGPAQQELALRACTKGRVVVVGDGRQAIYRFRGADAGSMDTMRERLSKHPRGVRTFPLTMTRRCPTAHVRLAQCIVPQIQALPDAPAGAVNIVGREVSKSMMRAGDLVIARTNRPLVQCAYALLRRSTKAVIRGRDIGKGLVALLEKGNGGQNDGTLSEVMRDVDSYVINEIQKLAALGPKGEARMESLTDRYGCLKTMTDGCATVAEVKARIDRIFADFTDDGKPNDAVVLGTIHRTKGLEAPRVFVLDPGDMPHPMAQGPEQQVQELNLVYIACTRAKFVPGREEDSGVLYFCGPVPLPVEAGAKALGVSGVDAARLHWKKEQEALRRRKAGKAGDTRPGVMIAMERLEKFGLGAVVGVGDTYGAAGEGEAEVAEIEGGQW